jgi:hypothetical protein
LLHTTSELTVQARRGTTQHTRSTNAEARITGPGFITSCMKKGLARRITQAKQIPDICRSQTHVRVGCAIVDFHFT